MVGSDRRKWFALALILAVQFMVILDVAIVNVALPSIQIDLGFSQENLHGGHKRLRARLPAASSYSRWPLRDLLGRRRVFIAGTVVFTIGSLLCGFAWSDEA